MERNRFLNQPPPLWLLISAIVIGTVSTIALVVLDPDIWLMPLVVVEAALVVYLVRGTRRLYGGKGGGK
jgi:hypothetical protein